MMKKHQGSIDDFHKIKNMEEQLKEPEFSVEDRLSDCIVGTLSAVTDRVLWKTLSKLSICRLEQIHAVSGLIIKLDKRKEENK